MNNKTRKWLRGALEILVHGGTAALIAGVSTFNVDEISWKSWWKLVVTSFMCNGGLRFLQYFNNNPLPESGDNTIEPTKVLSINPLSKVEPVIKPTTNV